MIIGLMGLAHSGKTEVGSILRNEHGFSPSKFAEPLKSMSYALMDSAGVCMHCQEEYIEGDRKEEIVPQLGVSARFLMQKLGTEFGRNVVRESFWVDLWKDKLKRYGLDNNWYVDDLRFRNEADAVREMGGVIVLVKRPGVQRLNNHPSETEMDLITPDFTIINDRSIEDLDLAIQDVLGLMGVTTR